MYGYIIKKCKKKVYFQAYLLQFFHLCKNRNEFTFIGKRRYLLFGGGTFQYFITVKFHLHVTTTLTISLTWCRVT